MANSRDLELLVQEYTSMGFDTQEIIMAWLNTNQRKALVLDYLLVDKEKSKARNYNISSKINSLTQSQILEEQTQKVIKLSLEEKEKATKPDQLIRCNGNPVGLKNIGNTCYFNSFLQTILQIKELLQEILTFQPPQDIDRLLAEMEVTDSTDIKRKKACVKLILALKNLVVLMFYGNKCILDPSEVTRNLVDVQGNPMKVGEQLDVGEFAINFLERIEEGLSLNSRPQTEGEANTKKITTNFKELFFGTSKDLITFEWGDFKTKKDMESVFGPISLSITQKDLMSSLDAFINFSVDGYQTPNGEITTAKKNIWITQAPKVFTFVLQRSVYDREKGMMKANDPFTFPKEIYIDRFLHENKKFLKNMTEDRKSMKNKLKRIDNEIARLKEFGQNKANLLAALETAAGFLEEQADEIEQDFVEVNSDTSEDKLECCGDLSELKRSAEILKEYKEKIEKRLEVLEKKRQNIKVKLENSYKSLLKAKYRLHSIVVHEGGINGGHYYSLIYNANKNKWMRFNDSIVDEVSEQEAFKLATGEGPSAQKGKNPCAYCLFYVEEKCSVIDFTPECMEGLKKFLSKDLLNMAETENLKFLTEYQHYNQNYIQKIYDDYLLKMNSVNFEAAKFQNDLRSKVFPFLPTLPNFNSFLLLEAPKCLEVARWNSLKAILTQKKVPYNVLEGERRNYYYYELRDYLVDNPSAYNLKSLELGEGDKELLTRKKREYVILAQCLIIIENIFELIKGKKWKETMATINLLHDTLGQIKMNDYSSQFYSFSSYLLAVMGLKYCSLIDMYQKKADTKEALKLLEILIYCMNRKESIKPPEIFYKQITNNLYFSINLIGKKVMKEADVSVFTHHIQKFEEKCVFMPSQDLSLLVSSTIKNELATLQVDDVLFRTFETKNFTKLNELYNSILKDRLKIWVDFESLIRKKNALVDQNMRVEKEAASWNE